VSTEQGSAPRYVTLVCQGATRATRLAAFPADDPLENNEIILRHVLPASRVRAIYTSPAASARETALALGLNATPAEDLGECDFGRWRGLRLHEVNAKEPQALEAWFKDPAAIPHGGESIQNVGNRAKQWLDNLTAQSGHVVAITNSVVIRQLIVRVLEAPASSFWRIDVTPLSCVDLASNGARWSLRTA
jgi:broad specificity phosphatase PhoE